MGPRVGRVRGQAPMAPPHTKNLGSMSPRWEIRQHRQGDVGSGISIHLPDPGRIGMLTQQNRARTTGEG